MLDSAQSTELERVAHDATLVSVRKLWNGPDPAINPAAPLRSLGDHELGLIVASTVAYWICARARQVTQTRIDVERLICTMSGSPEPWEAGTIVAALPALGEFVGEKGLTQLPIGEWSRENIIAFAWACFCVVDAARTERDEMPTDPPFSTDLHPLVAG